MEKKDKIAICVVGYNRLSSLKRLLSSLQMARYDIKDVPLIISIDCSGDEELYSFVRSYLWQHGEKTVIIHEKKLGLKEHILRCGDFTSSYRGVIILEDDIFVSPFFYSYALCAVNFYEEENRIGGISLYKDEMGYTSVPHIFMDDGSDAFLRQEPSSWGELWTSSQWMLFRTWLKSFKEEDIDAIDMPCAYKNRKRAWSKYFVAYLVQTNRFVLYPRFSLTTCFSEVGDHTNDASTVGQVNLLQGSRRYVFEDFNKMTKYDIYDTNLDIYQWLGYANEELCVDWYGMNPNINKKRFLLTPAILPFKSIKSYGLLMRPIELNVKYNIEGKDIFLYDTIDGNYNLEGIEMPISVAYYYLRMFKRNLAKKYVVDCYKKIIRNKLLKKVRKA